MAVTTLVSSRAYSLITLGDEGSLSGGWGHAESARHLALRGGGDRERNLWAAELDALVLGADRAVVLLAEGASCFAAAWWARLSPANYVSRIAGAVLAPEIDSGAVERHARRFLSPRDRLPFPSAVIGTGPDAGWSAMASGWGSELLSLAEPEPVQERSSPWSQARAFLMRISSGVVEREVSAGDRLIAALHPPTH